MMTRESSISWPLLTQQRRWVITNQNLATQMIMSTYWNQWQLPVVTLSWQHRHTTLVTLEFTFFKLIKIHIMRNRMSFFIYFLFKILKDFRCGKTWRILYLDNTFSRMAKTLWLPSINWIHLDCGTMQLLEAICAILPNLIGINKLNIRKQENLSV